MVKISDFIFSFIENLGVKDVFMVSGGGNMHLVNSVGANKRLNYVCNHHEQASAIAAEAYSRVSENIGVCLVTSGPGGTNTITGVLGAWLDSIPVLYISGQVKRDVMVKKNKLRELGVQEAPIVDIVKPITKYAVTVVNPQKIKYHLEKAVFLAKNNRPGPVWLDIPLDVQASMIKEKSLKGFNPKSKKYLFLNKDLRQQVSKVITLIKKAKRPIIFAGHGIGLSKTRDIFITTIEKLRIPVVTSMSATDTIKSNHDLFIGRPGVFGNRSGNFAVQNSDLLIVLGARLHLLNIGYDYKSFARKAKKVVVDIDPAELKKKTIKPDLAINTNVKDFIIELNKQINKIKSTDFSEWRKQCLDWKKRYPVVLPKYKTQKRYVNSYYFTEMLSDLLKEDEIIVTGVGTAKNGTIQSIKIKKRQHFYCNVGCAAMGYGLPAAIGACFANNKKRIVLIIGDGGIMMNLQELQTVSYNKLPIKIFLLNNKGYLTIKNTQNTFFNGNFVASTPKTGVSFPNFKKIAKAFNIRHETIKSHKKIQNKIRKALNCNGPVLCEINMSPNQSLRPKVCSRKRSDGTIISKPIEDMSPPLNRKEFFKNMIIKPIKK